MKWNAKQNKYTRAKRKLYDDDIQICECFRKKKYGYPGYNDPVCNSADCHNRMTREECCAEYCGENCKNQRFQKKQWKKVRVTDLGGKGKGLIADENIFAGEFVIEYVGEVIDYEEMLTRMEANEGKETHHYYFDIGANKGVGCVEYIDAQEYGNIARFINHSCDPNLQAQTWNVLAEKCVGFFALRDIKKDEELSFDYQFKVFNAENRQKCLCGSANCRGWLDGSLKTNTKLLKKKKWEYKPSEIIQDKEERCLYNSFRLLQHAFTSKSQNAPSAFSQDLVGLWGQKFCDLLGLEKSKKGSIKKMREALLGHRPERKNYSPAAPCAHDWQKVFLEEVTLDSVFGNRTPEPPVYRDPIQEQVQRLTKEIAAASGPGPDDIQPARIIPTPPINTAAIIKDNPWLKLHESAEEDQVDIVNKQLKKPMIDLLVNDPIPVIEPAQKKRKRQPPQKPRKRQKVEPKAKLPRQKGDTSTQQYSASSDGEPISCVRAKPKATSPRVPMVVDAIIEMPPPPPKPMILPVVEPVQQKDIPFSPECKFWCFHCESAFTAAKAAIKQIEHECFTSSKSKSRKVQRWRLDRKDMVKGFVKKCKFKHEHSYFCIISMDDYEKQLTVEETKQEASSPISEPASRPPAAPHPVVNKKVSKKDRQNLQAEHRLALLPTLTKCLSKQIWATMGITVKEDWNPKMLPTSDSEDLSEAEDREEEKNVSFLVVQYQGSRPKQGRMAKPVTDASILTELLNANKSISRKDVEISKVQQVGLKICFEVRVLNAEKQTVISKLKFTVGAHQCYPKQERWEGQKTQKMTNRRNRQRLQKLPIQKGAAAVKKRRNGLTSTFTDGTLTNGGSKFSQQFEVES